MNEFKTLIGACHTISEETHGEAIFIGGIAIYLHSINNQNTKDLAETTHDGDFCVSQVGMIDLRDSYEVIPNKRLGKSQLTEKGFEFDIYTEYQNDLKIPYDQIAAGSIDFDAVKVARLEHLLILKLAAFEDRKGTQKGNKDARDIVKILSVADILGGLDLDIVKPYWSDEFNDLLYAIKKGSTLTEISNGNAHEAKKYRKVLDDFILNIEKKSEKKPRI